MQLKELFHDETSRATTDQVKEIIWQKPEIYEELFELVLQDEDPYSRRAMWVFDTCDEELPGIAKQYLPVLIDRLSTFTHSGLRRHSLRILTRYAIPGEKVVALLNFCFEMLQGAEPAAVKVHAMQILYNISQDEPELKQELIPAIELAIQEGTTGTRNRGSKLLKKLSQEVHRMSRL
jgi:hypothetical protein